MLLYATVKTGSVKFVTQIPDTYCKLANPSTWGLSVVPQRDAGHGLGVVKNHIHLIDLHMMSWIM